MVIREGFFLIAQRLQEAADVAHSDVRQHLRDAIRDAHRGTETWADYIDHTGDGQTGDVIYRANGETRSAPYEIASLNGKASVNVDAANAKRVMPFVQYRDIADDDDNYTASLSESMTKTLKLYTELPLYERFISKSERETANDDSFAGKNKSFPILKPGDVSAAVHAMGRAGADNYGPAQIKANIIRISKAKGWTDELPKAWRGEKTTEAAKPNGDVARETLALIESAGCEFLEAIDLREEGATGARTHYPIKIISPGTGSTAHYPAEVLERDGPKVFKRGTLMFWNHPTQQEASQRPEGNLDHLAAITTSDAKYMHDGPKGPGLYAEAKPMADYAQKIEARAPHIGLSIRAGGSGDGTKVNGKPVLKSIDYVESVDYVTKAGRGGMALAEAARDAGILLTEGEEMTLEEAKKMVQDEVAKATAPLILVNMRSEAREEATRVLESVNFPVAAKLKIVANAVAIVEAGTAPVVKDGVLNLDEFRKCVVAEAKAMGTFIRELTGGGQVHGMGPSVGAAFDHDLTEAQIEEREKAQERAQKSAKRVQEGAIDIFSRITGNPDVARKAATKNGVAA